MKTSIIPFSPVRHYMEKFGAEIVERDAVYFLNEFLEKKAREIARESQKIANFAQRKKVTEKDIQYIINKNFPQILVNKIIPEEPQFLAIHPMRELFEEEGCEIVSREAIPVVNVFLEICIEEITKKAVNLLSHINNRKKITEKDFEYVIKEIFIDVHSITPTVKQKEQEEYIAHSPTKTLAHSLGIKMVEDEAITFLNSFLEENAKILTKLSQELSIYGKRKKIMTNDLNLAIDRHFNIKLEEFNLSNMKEVIFAIAPFRRLMGDQKAELVAQETVELLVNFLDTLARIILIEGKNQMEKNNDKKLKSDHLKQAIEFKIYNKEDKSNKSSPINISDNTNKILEPNKEIGKKCSFCGNLCSPNAKMCPKCGDPFD
jgi:histone H3/H4